MHKLNNFEDLAIVCCVFLARVCPLLLDFMWMVHVLGVVDVIPMYFTNWRGLQSSWWKDVKYIGLMEIFFFTCGILVNKWLGLMLLNAMCMVLVVRWSTSFRCIFQTGEAYILKIKIRKVHWSDRDHLLLM